MRYKELVSIYAILRASICVMDLLLSLQQKHLLKTIFGRGLARRATSDSSKKKIYIRISLQKLLFIQN